MTKTGTILKAMQAVLLVTVLTPAISHADPLSTRMMLAQAQTQSQDQAVKGEVKKLNRGLILGTAEAATNPNVQRPVEIPQVTAPVTVPTAPTPVVATVEAPQVEIPALPPRNDDKPAANNTYTTAAASVTTATTANSSVVTLPAPQPTTDTVTTPTTTPVTTDVATTPVTPVAPVTVVPTTTPATTASTNVDSTPANTAKADTTTVKPTPTKTSQASHQRHPRSDDSVDVGGVKLNAGNLNGQINKIMGRSDVKSMLSQYGLN
jgi:hypothetical protein